LALVTVAASLGSSLPLLSLREYAGSPALIARIASTVEPNGVVLFDDDLIGWRLSAPLEFVGDRTSFVLFGQTSDEGLRVPLAEWSGSGRPLYWLHVGDGPAVERWGRSWQPAAHLTPGW